MGYCSAWPEGDDDVAGDDGADLPPALVDTERGEVASQQAYIDELERLLLGAGLGVPWHPAAPSSDAAGQQYLGSSAAALEALPAPSPVALRHENRVLRAKVLMLQRQLQEAHARCRRAGQINARWREQHGALRRRERESWAALQQALKKLERQSAAQSNSHKLRDSFARRSAELGRAELRIAELEQMCEQLRGALATAMRGLQPEALDALT